MLWARPARCLVVAFLATAVISLPVASRAQVNKGDVAGYGPFHLGITRQEAARTTSYKLLETDNGSLNVLGFKVAQSDAKIQLQFGEGPLHSRSMDDRLQLIIAQWPSKEEDCKQAVADVRDHLTHDELTPVQAEAQTTSAGNALTVNFASGRSITFTFFQASGFVGARCQSGIIVAGLNAPQGVRIGGVIQDISSIYQNSTQDRDVTPNGDGKSAYVLPPRDTETLIMPFTEYRIADRCASADYLFTAGQVRQIGAELSRQIAAAGCTTVEKDSVWSATAGAQSSPLTRSDCDQVKVMLRAVIPATMLPDTSADEKSPF